MRELTKSETEFATGGITSSGGPGTPSSAVRGVIFVFWRSVIVVVQGFARPRRGNAVVSRIVIEA